METLRLIWLISDTLLVFIGVYLVLTVARVYSVYRFIGFTRTVVTPFLLVGLLFAFLGITDTLEPFAEDVGSLVHSVTMLLVAFSLTYGLRYYHKMLKKVQESKKLLEEK